MTPKPVVRLHGAYRDDIGDLVTRRPIPSRELNNIGAFLFLNHHGPQTYPPNNRGLPFGPHPHRGFETVTFILEGELAHRDSAGHESIIEAGGVQWMTAGSGLVHEEVSPERFKRSGGPMEILQLWVNLPARLKLTAPAYTGVQQETIPAIETDEGRAKVNLISGQWQGRTGPITSLTGIFMTTLELKAEGRVVFEGLTGRDIFFYVARGDVAVNGVDAARWQLVEFGEGDLIDIEATTDSVVLFGHAEPLREPIVAHGPFVMNTVEEIHQAYADFQAGKFG
ncbi:MULTISPECIES: pirin family protein [Asticcacaulis]|uniref:pirin family protein n=1 Tax=Asticcacaulis TaxID=76890 RepID=UPI001AE72C29|nr:MULTISPECIES: pirin family protein [Asticcacaulis]MBP2160167.1 redox-sensitive bicupin YhaK (pirin superfamily) [Asticcacaulis solisilvae]MDR6801212.1 redox-sensitive bicupin YhaK (pirin superfamily) [Asticcacaulis sp. BE141]